jgi:abortive infection bacteriophage resistance protein
MEKPFKPHDDLILLLEKRGIDFSKPGSKSTAKKYLQRIGYYNLINGYSSLFYEDGKVDSYLPGTTIDEIYALYIFDRKIRAIVLENILPFEENIKALIAYHFPKAHPESNYLTYTNFDNAKKDASKNVTSLIAGVQKQIADRSSDPSIEHYLRKYGYVPLWVLTNILSLGTISKFYSLMQQKERQDIAKTFRLQDKELESVLMYVSSVRNFCAHGNRLYCYRTNRPLSDSALHDVLQIPRNEKGEYAYGKRDLFAVLIALKLVQSKTQYRKMLHDVNGCLNELAGSLSVIAIKDVLVCMGFPEDWRKKLQK